MPKIVAAKHTPSGEAVVAVQRARVAELEAAGVQLAGHAFSQILFVQGEPSSAAEPNVPLAGQVGTALHASLERLGYAPVDWGAVLTYGEDGQRLAAETLRLAISALDPATLVAIDESAAAALREAYAEELAELGSLEAACLALGAEAHVLGMRVVYLGAFAAALESGDQEAKQRAWAILKRLAPLGEPY